MSSRKSKARFGARGTLRHSKCRRCHKPRELDKRTCCCENCHATQLHEDRIGRRRNQPTCFARDFRVGRIECEACSFIGSCLVATTLACEDGEVAPA